MYIRLKKKKGLECIILLMKLLGGDCGGSVWKSSHWPLGNPIPMVGNQFSKAIKKNCMAFAF